VNGPIIVPFNTAAIVPAGTGFTFNATVALPAASEAAFLGGGTYVNIHTTAFPAGAIRGQIFSQGNVNLATGRATGTASITGFENVQGGSGSDSLVGNNLANFMNGGGGADWIVGAPGADTMSGGAGDDVLVWSNGDGTDVMEGGSESDLVQVNGAVAAGDQFVVSANGTRVDFDRVNLVPFSLDIGTVETLTVNGIGAIDTMTVNSLAGVASLSTLNLNGFDGDDLFNFAASSSSGIAFNVHGGPGTDVLQGPNSAVTWNVTGPNQGNITGLVTSFSFVDILMGGSANDTFNLTSFANAPLQVNGGGGSDTIIYNAQLRTVSGDTSPPDGTISSAGVATITFSETELVNIINGPPTNLFASSIIGNLVTLRWSPTISQTVTEYQLEGGLTPGQVLATVRTGNTAPIFTFIAPNGAFYVRARAVAGTQVSDLSNEIRIFVNVAVPPSAPTGLTGTVNGSAVELSWRNTFAGGAPSTIRLDVTGSLSGTIPIGSGETARFPVVPGGTYTVSLRAANASGVSGSSNAITLSVPGPCSGPPSPPENFLAYKIGNRIHVIWNPASTGPASTGYVLIVSGPFSINFPTTFRALSGVVPAGTYNLSVLAANTCGFSAPTPAQTVVVP
jgi:CHRD domain/RTX calcium-binding nonapeptide repeat (4 copies)